MLRQVAEGVLIHESEFIESKAVVVQGKAGVLLIDAGITAEEMAALADDLRELGQPVVAAFSTHPHWDHLLWHAKLGEAPRYGTARCAADIQAFLSNPHWKDDVAEELPPEIEVPLDLLGLITGLPAGTTQIPWDGPKGSPLGDLAACGALRRWLNGVVPLTVELVPRQRHRRQLLVAHLDAKRVAAPV